PREERVQGFWTSDSIDHVETITVRPLDDVLAQEGIDCGKRAVYLKLDTQGYDLEVIKGASRSLADIRALQTEASVRPIYQDMPSYQTSIDVLTESGFDISGMFPVTLDGALRLVEFDCVMVNGRYSAQLPS